MRTLSILAALLTLSMTSGASAGIPDPVQSGLSVTGQGASCQFRFFSDGSLDRLTVSITLRDNTATIVPNCTTSVGIQLAGAHPGGGPCGYPAEAVGKLCSCCPLVKGGFTDSDGVVKFEFSQLGGRGVAKLCVTAHCTGAIPIGCKEFSFSSTDLNASCDADPDPATNVLDLGIWAGCLPPAPVCQASDYDCTCSVGVLDVAFVGIGLGKGGCGVTPCP